jgi:Tfp pilus assembly protein FimT
MPRYQVKSAAQDLRAELQKAKMEAVKSNQEALIIFDKADAGSQGGYTTCINNDGNQVCQQAQGDIILAQKTFTANNYKHALLKNPGFTNGEHFKFNSRGIPVQDDGSYFSSGSVEIENGKDSSYTLSITVSPSGRIRID